ncbi:hypothetical protein BOTBODRAFT_178967 [Botryobasidium botryosum FD-172 SS1]|uniref:Protein kinase domain-containing protein n=1 Tax=Botryobasidium botryosum (strain FD-172 SS1) TaxID=930990 RepID=A0A067M1I4_BOTB1|nr:hypothetical protein BOTBODRAFT_178967 [Botryobasidium botryosum FD-172 SS1]
MGENIEGRDSKGRTKLHHAIDAKDFQLAKRLIVQGANVRACDSTGREPLHFLAQLETDYLGILSPSPFAEIIQFLLNAGADLNDPGTHRRPPLYHAYIQYSSLIFRLLVDAGADLSLLDPLIGADMRRFLVCVLHPPDDTADFDYLPAGVDVNATHSVGYQTYLDRAVWLGSPSAVKALLRRGANPNVQNWGRAPLHYAFNLMQHSDGAGAIQALVDAAADINAMFSSSGTPLDVAISHACPPAFCTILARGGRASTHFSGRFLRAPGGTDVVIDLIEAKGSLACYTPRAYGGVLCRAVQRGSLKAVRWLLERHADLHARDVQSRTPLHYLVDSIMHSECEETLLAFLQAGVSINTTDSNGRTLLQLAVEKSSCRAAQLLLRKGADPHAGGTYGAASPQFVMEMLEIPDGISMMLKLARAGLIVDDAPRYRMKVRHRPNCFKLIGEVRKISAVDPPSVRSACVAFLSTFYPLIERYPFDPPLHEWEVELTKTEKSVGGGYSDCCEGLFLGHHKVAMKALRAHIMGNKVAERRMKREMNVWSKLRHPNVLPFIGWCTLKSTSYMVSPWMENGDALAYVKQKPQADRLKLLAQIAEGLYYLHTRPKNPVIHGDIKAANVLISSSGVACIADFGLSELIEDEKAPRYSTEWYCAGNPRWQAPELLSAESKEEARRTKETDCFAYGRVMLEIFTGQVPFFYLSVNTTLSVFNMVLDGRLPDRPLDKDTVAKGLDDRMWELMKTCWRVDPKQRPSAADILGHLKAALRGRPESSASARPEKRARLMEPSVKVEGFGA